MIRNDYIMRLIEQFVRILSELISKQKSLTTEQIYTELDKAAINYLSLDLELLNKMTWTELLHFFTHNEERDAARCYIAAEMILTYAYLNKRHMDIPEPRIKALALYLEAITTSPELQKSEYFNKVNDVLEKVSAVEIPEDLKLILFRFYELTNEYGRAENILFELTELAIPDLEKIGIDFYQRLLKLSDQELAAGNLPREEVQEGMQTFRQKSHLNRP